MKIFNKKLLLILLIILVMFSIIIIKPDKKVILDSVQVVDNTNNKFAIQYQVNGEYKDIDRFLGKEDGYILNTELSKCQNEEGKELDNNVIQYDNQNKTLTIDTKTTSYCYLFFDEEENISNLCNGSIMEICMKEDLTKINNLNADQAGMYRYQGSNTDVNNNYICFGTDDVDACKSNEDKYMYRIIGITEDGMLKLIKKTSVNREGAQWHSVNSSEWNTSIDINEKLKNADVKWSESDLYKRLNGLSSNNDNLFIGNDNYEYLKENSDWYNKIFTYEWLSGRVAYNTILFEPAKIHLIESGQLEGPHNNDANPYYYNGGIEFVSKDVKYIERRTIDSITCEKYDGTGGIANCVVCSKPINNLFDDKTSSKIGLMNITDYEFAVQENGFNCHMSNILNGNEYIVDGEKCKNNWIQLSNNDTKLQQFKEWMMNSVGFSSAWNTFASFYTQSRGDINTYSLEIYLHARPVFYLNNSITIKSGNGSINNPYIIK